MYIYLGGISGLDLKSKRTGMQHVAVTIASAIRYICTWLLYSSSVSFFSSMKKFGKINPKIIPNVFDKQHNEVIITL